MTSELWIGWCRKGARALFSAVSGGTAYRRSLTQKVRASLLGLSLSPAA